MRHLLILLVGLLLASGAWAQPSGKGVVANCTNLQITDGDCAGLGTGTRVYDTDNSVELTYDGTSWVTSGLGVNTASHQKTEYITGIGSLTVGTCAPSATANINTGTQLESVICPDNNLSSIFFNKGMPDNWDAGTFQVELHTLHDGAPPADNLSGDLSATCIGSGELLGDETTYTPEVASDIIGYTTQYEVRTVESTVTPNCAGADCQPGDHCFFRWQMDAGDTTTAVANLHFLGFRLGWTVTNLDEVQ